MRWSLLASHLAPPLYLHHSCTRFCSRGQARVTRVSRVNNTAWQELGEHTHICPPLLGRLPYTNRVWWSYRCCSPLKKAVQHSGSIVLPIISWAGSGQRGRAGDHRTSPCLYWPSGFQWGRWSTRGRWYCEPFLVCRCVFSTDRSFWVWTPLLTTDGWAGKIRHYFAWGELTLSVNEKP